jgi:hypothetical protein
MHQEIRNSSSIADNPKNALEKMSIYTKNVAQK